MRSLPLVLCLASTLVLAAPQARVADPIDAVLLSSAAPDSLRVRLETFAAQAKSRRAMGLALHYRGMSFEHDGSADSAIACYRRSLAMSRTSPSAEPLVAALLRRRGPGDVQEVLRMFETPQGEEEDRPEAAEALGPEWNGWAHVLAGEAKRGLELLKPLEADLSGSLAWRYRLARACIEAGAADDSRKHLVALDIAARGQDGEIRELIQRADKALSCELCRNEFHKMLDDAPKDAEAAEAYAMSRLGGRPVRFRASDGSMIGATLIADSMATHTARPVLVLGDIGARLTDYDSLATALRIAGYATLILDPRGSGQSVGPGFALPDTWTGRQHVLQARVAKDVREGLRAFARLARIDTTRCLAIGIGRLAPVALMAAQADRRIVAVALVDPIVSADEWGAALQRARSLKLPLYVALGPASREERAFADTLVQSAPKGASLRAEAPAIDQGARTFGSAPDLTPGFVRWADRALSTAPTRRESRGSVPRSG